MFRCYSVGSGFGKARHSLENEKDRVHLVGRTSVEKKVTVDPEILAQ
jgi:hypothetical protein